MEFVNGFAGYNAMVSEENQQVQVQAQIASSDEKSSVRPKKKGKKQRKVPQRGLGVAQLERMRIEEQKKEVGSSSSPLMAPAARGATIPASSYNYEIPIPSFNFCPIVPDQILPSTWDFTPQIGSVDSSEFMFGFGFPSAGGSSLAAEKPLSYQQRLDKVPSMVKVSSTNSCCSGVSNQELPSNQIHLTNNITARSQEKRIVGMKRPLPFFFEHSTISPPASLPWSTSSPPQFFPFANNCYKSASWQDLCNYDSASTVSKEGRSPSSSGGMLQNESDNISCYWESNIEYLDGGFLSLSPPPMSTISKLNRECYPFPQADGNAQISSPNSNPLFEMEPPKPIYYSFLPEHQALSHCDTQREGRDDGSMILDLTLKLCSSSGFEKLERCT